MNAITTSDVSYPSEGVMLKGFLAKASIPFYGQIPPTDSLKYLVAPILYIHGGQDTWILKREAERLAQGLKQFGRPGEVKIYPDCPHAFFNDTRPEVYRPEEAKDAWHLTLRFLKEHLQWTRKQKDGSAS